MWTVKWIENDGTISKETTTCSLYLAKDMQKSGLIAKKLGLIKDCILEEVTNE